MNVAINLFIPEGFQQVALGREAHPGETFTRPRVLSPPANPPKADWPAEREVVFALNSGGGAPLTAGYSL